VTQEASKVIVHIFGEQHVIKGKGSEEYIRNLAYDVDRRMKEISLKYPLLAAHQVAVLVSLNMADEIARLKEEHKTLLDMLGEKPES
jgi:cell division protein ZapA